MSVSKRPLIFLLVLLLAGVAFAQSGQTGTISGKVVTADGLALPGVAVTLKSPAIVMAQLTTVTNENGIFRFPNLAPGMYEVTLELDGFNTSVRKSMQLFANQVMSLDFTMQMKTLQEAIVVTGQAPTVDKQTTTKAINMDKEYLKSLPSTRTLATYFNMVPGVTGDTAHGGTQMDNSYNLDGVNMGDPATGTQGSSFGTDIMEEISVQTGGLSAEYGSVRGAMVNIITKSGGNNYSGTASFYYNHEKLKADNTKGTVLEGKKSGNKYGYEPVVTLGGPIVKDRLWFFVNLSMNKTASFVAGYPYDKPGSGMEVPITQYYPYLKLTYQPNQKNKFIFSYSYSDRKNDHRGASIYSLESTTYKQKSPTHVINAHWTRFFGNNLYTNLKLGINKMKLDFVAKGDETEYWDMDTGLESGNYWRNKDLNQRDRYNLNFDATTFVDNFLGTHEIKFGAEAQWANVDWTIKLIDDPASGDSAIDYYTQNGVKYYYDGLDLKNNGFTRKDQMRDYFLFLQDTWNPIPRLTLNLGLRLDYNTVVWPEQNNISKKQTPLEWTNLSPRLGANFDIFGDGKTVLKASFARYTAANQTGWVNTAHLNGWEGYYHYYAEGTPIGQKPTVIAREVWASPSTTKVGYKDHDLKAPYTDEITIGIERELFEDVSLSARYIQKWDRNNIHLVDAAQLDIDQLFDNEKLVWKGWSPVTAVDPFNGQTVTFYKRSSYATEQYIVNPPGANRDYKGFELILNKRFSKGWSFNASYVYAKAEGLLDSARGSESLGTSQLWNDPNTHINAYGELPLERKHQLKVQSVVRGPFGISLSGYFRFLAGGHYTRSVSSKYLGISTSKMKNTSIYAEARGARKLPDVKILDLRLEKSFKFGNRFAIAAFADCFNVFNQGIATSVWTDSSNKARAFEQMTSISDPRIFQLGGRIEF